MVHQILDLGAILGRQAVARGVGDVDHGGAGLDHGLDHLGQELVVRTAGILGVEFHVLDELPGILHGAHGPLQDLLTRGVELVADVRVGGADAGVDALVLGVLERLHGSVDILLHRPGEGAHGRPGHGLGDLHDRVEVAGTRDREAGLDDVHAELLQRLRHLDFLHGVELAAGHLFAVAQGGVEDKDPVVVHTNYLFSGRSSRTAAPVRQSSLSRRAFSSFSSPSR